jgi:hypothetical protein
MTKAKTEFATREEAEAAMAQAQAFFAKEADSRRQALLTQAAPIIDLAKSPELAMLRAAATDLYPLSKDEEAFPNLRNTLTCLDAGINGLRSLAEQIERGAATAAMTAVEAPAEPSPAPAD